MLKYLLSLTTLLILGFTACTQQEETEPSPISTTKNIEVAPAKDSVWYNLDSPSDYSLLPGIVNDSIHRYYLVNGVDSVEIYRRFYNTRDTLNSAKRNELIISRLGTEVHYRPIKGKYENNILTLEDKTIAIIVSDTQIKVVSDTGNYTKAELDLFLGLAISIYYYP